MDAINGVIDFGTGGNYTGAPSRTADCIVFTNGGVADTAVNFGGLFEIAIPQGRVVSIPCAGCITIGTGFAVSSAGGGVSTLAFVR